MVMTVTGEYALRAALHLARHHPRPRTCVEIAEATQVPPSYLSKILQALVRGQLARSQRGSGGGFLLAAPPQEISVLDVLGATGSPPHRVQPWAGHRTAAPNPVSLQRLVEHAEGLVEAAFSSASLAALLGDLEVEPAAGGDDGWPGSSDPCDPWPVPDGEGSKP